jgi:hypothetical protein
MFKLVEHGSKTVKVQRGTKVKYITVDRLKPAFVDESVEILVAQPPCRGQPPGVPPVVPRQDLQDKDWPQLGTRPGRPWEQTARAQEDGKKEIRKSGRQRKKPERLGQ